jgi:hypothetical protein
MVFASLLTVCSESDRDRKQSDAPVVHTDAHDASRDETLSPIDRLVRVREYHRTGRLSLVERSIVPEQRTAVSELLYTVDRLGRAGDAFHEAVRKHLGLASAEMFDYSQVANIIGVFSRDVELIDQRIEGDAAVVTIQVAGRVPLDEVHLVLRDGQWLITTDPPIAGLAVELRKLADVWVDLSRQIEKQRLTASELKRELDARQGPITRRIAALTHSTQP